jgi:hypothetical protein
VSNKNQKRKLAISKKEFSQFLFGVFFKRQILFA